MKGPLLTTYFQSSYLEQLYKSFSKVSSLYIQSATLPGEINLLKKMSETAA